MRLIFFILTIFGLNQVSLAEEKQGRFSLLNNAINVNVGGGLFGDLLKPIDVLLDPLDDLLDPIDTLINPAGADINANLQLSLDANKQNLLDGLLGNSVDQACAVKSPRPGGLLGFIGSVLDSLKILDVVKSLTNTVIGGLNHLTSFLGVTIDLQTNVFDSYSKQEQANSENLQNYINSQFGNFVGDAGQQIDLDSDMDAVNSCMQTLLEQVSATDVVSNYVDCNPIIDTLVKKLKGIAATTHGKANVELTNALEILENRKTSIGSILEAKQLIDSYTSETFVDAAIKFIDEVKACMKGKVPDKDYKELLTLIDSLKEGLKNVDGLSLDDKINVVNNVIATLQTWIDEKVNSAHK